MTIFIGILFVWCLMACMYYAMLWSRHEISNQKALHEILVWLAFASVFGVDLWVILPVINHG